MLAQQAGLLRAAAGAAVCQIAPRIARPAAIGARRLSATSQRLSQHVDDAMAAALAARTGVRDRTSPPALIAAKQQELAAIGPGGWRKLLAYRLLTIPIACAAGARLLLRYATRPWELGRAPDASQFDPAPPFPLHEEFISVNGIRLHTVSPGRQPGKPLMLMLHGFPECWHSWRHQMAAFAGDFDVVALDMRGYNTSDKPRGVEAYRLPVLASDVAEAVRALGHERCTLVAHDWGGIVAWTAAGLYGPTLVERLIVMGLPHLGVAMTNTSRRQYARSSYILLFQAPFIPEQLIAGDSAASMRDFFLGEPAGLCNKAALSEADIQHFRKAMSQPGAATAALNYYRALVAFTCSSDPGDPVWAALRRPLVGLPVLLLHGDNDVALGEELLDGVEAAVPHVTVKVLQNCSHWVQQDYPEQVTQLMRDWLDEPRRAGSRGAAAAGAAAPAGSSS